MSRASLSREPSHSWLGSEHLVAQRTDIKAPHSGSLTKLAEFAGSIGSARPHQ
jgi:hypothetical protein